jgi:hypothetical protein
MIVGKPKGIVGCPVYMERYTTMDLEETDRCQW